jgi:hypothetical protein
VNSREGWPGLDAAEQLRQWPDIAYLAERVASSPALAGLLLLGSFARGEADAFSDVDFIVFAKEGAFVDAWKGRHELHPSGSACWDYPKHPERDVAAHRWLTPDLVLFDGLVATTAGTRVADPFVVIVDDDALSERLIRRDPISANKKEKDRDELQLNEVERLYGELKLSARAALTASRQSTRRLG